MSTDQQMAVKDAVYLLQLSLLGGIKDQRRLFAAGTLMSRSDYEDVVTERTIANLCGYPLCTNSLPTNYSKRGRYRISLKEHKVYDLEELSRFCSSGCLINSRAFSKSLQEERCSVLNPVKLNEVLSLFQNSGSDDLPLAEEGDVGISRLKIIENEGPMTGEVSLEDWIGPSNAIEGYVPRKERKAKAESSKICKEGSDANYTKVSGKKDFVFWETDFMSAIITSDEYSVSKLPLQSAEATVSDNSKAPKSKAGSGKIEQQAATSGVSSSAGTKDSDKKSKPSKRKVKIGEKNQSIKQSVPNFSQGGSSGGSGAGNELAVRPHTMSETALKPSLKSKGAKKLGLSVTWADQTRNNSEVSNLCEVRVMQDSESAVEVPCDAVRFNGGGMLRFESAEACAIALCEATEAITNGESETSYAVSEAGITILPRQHHTDEGQSEQELAPQNWSRKPGPPNSDLLDPDQPWFDAPPEGFSMTLSPFAMMWDALFGWVTSSSLAYIYGKDESLHEDYLFVHGREYPRKIFLGDGRSSEIKEALAGYLERALPRLVADLALPVTLSDIEKRVACLLDTMSYTEALPALRMKQWQVIGLLFIDALSLYQLPTITPSMTNGRVRLHKVLDGAQIGVEEYEIMKDHLMPLGRAPQFAMQSGA